MSFEFFDELIDNQVISCVRAWWNLFAGLNWLRTESVREGETQQQLTRYRRCFLQYVTISFPRVGGKENRKFST